MNIAKLVEETMEAIVTGRTQDKAVQIFKKQIKKAGWPIAVNKEVVCNTIKMLVNNKVHEDTHERLLDTLLGIKRTLPKMTPDKIILLREIESIVRKAPFTECDHNFKIGVFANGGGFYPAFGLPELICDRCGANITISESDPKLLRLKGLKISKRDLDRLYAWTKKCFKDREIRIQFVSVVAKNPIKALRESVKWTHKFPFKIIDVEKLNFSSGS
ncbi:hypothetical protein KAW18_17455 [candidate division WOR-3 bacterium]|nr:hypothetical protein [candidate division WOR-3 bacterium]